MYVAHKEPRVSPSTYYKDFLRVEIKSASYLPKLLDDAIEIRDYLTNNFSLNTAKRIITNIFAVIGV